ncbi:hypothetical protein [Lentzea albida]|uniref:Uncharacterized protein n=1 Tax=Lentzea albida TaxID=65499 RepID=A0A1H9VG78_9PSEU|nr:hypothetical protein [Lentzea albida]SES20776.1 hypothetical protein SAMN04488000_118104 [Lentzea albida]
MRYWKLISALAGTVVLALQTALGDGSIDMQDVVIVSAAGLASFGAWLVPSTTALKTIKTWVFALVVGAGVLGPVLAGGVTPQEWMTVLVAVLTSAGVAVAPGPEPKSVVIEGSHSLTTD